VSLLLWCETKCQRTWKRSVRVTNAPIRLMSVAVTSLHGRENNACVAPCGLRFLFTSFHSVSPMQTAAYDPWIVVSVARKSRMVSIFEVSRTHWWTVVYITKIRISTVLQMFHLNKHAAAWKCRNLRAIKKCISNGNWEADLEGEEKAAVCNISLCTCDLLQDSARYRTNGEQFKTVLRLYIEFWKCLQVYRSTCRDRLLIQKLPPAWWQEK
jgi:hypothetical protein